MKKYKAKFILFFISFIITTMLIELSMQLMSLSVEKSNSIEILDNYDRQNHLEISLRENKSNIKIITLGDSFTFGGYGAEKESYPSQLQSMVDDKINIVNNGMCERTSSHILSSLEEAINLSSPNMIILLVGAANRFAPVKESNKFYDKIKVFKLFKLMGLYTDELEIRRKFKLEKNSDKYIEQIMHKFLVDDIDYNDYELPETVIKAFEIQSKRNAKELVYFFEHIKRKMKYNVNKERMLNILIDKFNSYENWDKIVEQKLIEDIYNIMKITKKLNIELVLSTYPVKYKTVNNIIRIIAKDNGLPLIDHAMEFEKIISKDNFSEYIKDDDHATKKGHHVMAQNVKKFLDSFLEEKRENLIKHGKED